MYSLAQTLIKRLVRHHAHILKNNKRLSDAIKSSAEALTTATKIPSFFCSSISTKETLKLSLIRKHERKRH